MPATPRHTSRARVEAKESSILDAAEKTFAEVGFDGAKVADIARAASDVVERGCDGVGYSQ